MTLLLSAWLAAFGVWPWADPGHSLDDGLLVWVDLLVHLLGVVVLSVEIRARSRS